MTNKERLELNNAKIEEITKTLARKQVSPTDMLQAIVDNDNSCAYLFTSYKGTNLDALKGLDTSKVTSMQSMFNGCSNLTSVDVSNFDTSNVESMLSMFHGCEVLIDVDVSNFNTSKVTKIHSMFYRCKALTSLDVSSFDLSNVTNLENMFAYCENLKTLNLSGWNTRNVTNIGAMFSYCNSLETIQNIDMVNVTSASSMLTGCAKLTNLYFKNIKVKFQIGSYNSWGTLLTDDSIINTFKELHDLTGQTTQDLILSTPSLARTERIYVKLIDITNEMRAEDEYIDNKKPCVVCESTDEGAMTLKEYGVSKNWNVRN